MSDKTCSSCSEAKPVREFYPDPGNKDGLSSNCRACNNRRRPTLARLLRNRARARANTVLIAKHAAEFAALLEKEADKVWVEHQQLAEEAAARAQHDAEIARLKPGPRRADEDETVQRLDVARCPSCETHHDDDHVCPECGGETPVEPEPLKPYVVRDWAISEGLEVPSRGPIPDRILDAYRHAHISEFIDEVAIERRMAGDKSVPLSKAEKAELQRRWERTDRSGAEMERITGVNQCRDYDQEEAS